MALFQDFQSVEIVTMISSVRILSRVQRQSLYYVTLSKMKRKRGLCSPVSVSIIYI